MNFDSGFFKILETLIGSTGVIISFLFGVFLVIKKNKYSRANLFLAIYLLTYSLRAGKSLFHSYYSINTTILTICLGSLLLIGPSLWLYSKHLLQIDYSRKRSIILLHFIPFFGLLCLSPIIPNNGEPSSKFFYLGLAFHGLIYCFVTLLQLIKTKGKILPERALGIKKWLIFLTVVTLLLFTNFLLVFFRFVPYHPRSSFLYTIVVLFLSIWAFENPWLFLAGNEKYSNSYLSNEKAMAYILRLDTLMEKEKLFLNPELNLLKLSQQIGTTSKQLSQAINQIKKENYSYYIAKYRIEESKKLLRHPKHKHFTIAAIAYECGFNSISSFNSAFKKLEKTTAIVYRKSISEQKNY